jgi:hypothetical protein
VLIIGSNLDHRIAERAGVVNTSPYFGYLSLVSERDLNRAIDFLEDEGGRKVFESPYPLMAITTSRFPELDEILRQRGFRSVRREQDTGFVEWTRR